MLDQRQELILKELHKNGKVTVSALVELTKASESSIRRDLVDLDNQGLLKRIHGGAVLIPSATMTMEDSLHQRQLVHSQQKRKIAEYAAGLIESDDVVYLDAGSTTLLMIDYLKEKNAKYITNGLMQAQQLATKGFKVVCIGGEVRNITGACIGASAIAGLNRYHFSKGFFGTNGVDAEGGLTTPDSEEAAIKELAIQKSRLCYVLCDHSKFNKVYSVSFGKIDDSIIITDYCQGHVKNIGTIVEVEKR